LSNISISIISQYFKEIKPIPPSGLGGSDNCIYDVTVSSEGGRTFVTLHGKDMNSFGDSDFMGIDGFQQSLLKSLYRSLSDKRKLICEGYGEYLEECGGGSSLKNRGGEEKKCYLTLGSNNKKNIKLFTNLSVSIVSQYVTKVEKDDPLIKRPLGKSDSCIYEITLEQSEETLFLTVTGEGLNSYGDSKLKGIKGFQQSLLQSLFRSLRDKRGMICDDYRDLLEECKDVVVEEIPKKKEPKVVETKVPTPNVVEVNKVCNPNKNVETANVGGYSSSIEKLFFDNGQIKYIGYLKNNIFHGFGTEYLEDGKVKYRGEWENGKYHGKGTLYDEDGFVDHKGEFICGEIE
jgi:antitoxin component YwqK of YwqJK toxin-antitoxin module